MKRTIFLGLTSCLMLAGAAGAAGASGATAGLPDRSADPVVLKGSQTPNLIGVAPGSVVAFKYDDGWAQVPVQVDERKWADYRVIRRVGLGSTQFGHEVYADPNTFTEADGVPQRDWTGTHDIIPGTTGDPMLDADDEIAMMASDSGATGRNAAPPAGVDDSTRTPVKITDPLDPSAASYIYLFKTTTGLDPSAGKDYVQYNQQYSPALAPAYKTAGSYNSGYNFNSIGDNVAGPPVNPESSSVTTDAYEQTFPGRWLVDGLKIKAGGASNVDILDGDKSMIGTTNCGRNELTFSRGAGGVIANIDGPVRAIRSYVGANSGTYTQRDQIYYRDMVDTETYLRVHAGITDFVLAEDLNQNAFGMTYRNNLNPAGVTIDGVPDNIALGQLDWEQDTGAQGTITDINRLDTTVPLKPITSYYLDDMNPDANNAAIECSGDTHAIGASGPRVQMVGVGVDTDPSHYPDDQTKAPLFTSHRHLYINGPNEPVATSELRSKQVDAPLQTTTGNGVDPVPVATSSPLKLRVAKVKRSVKPGKRVRIKVILKNSGSTSVGTVKVCPRAGKRLRTFGCKKIKSIRAGASASKIFPVVIRKGTGFKPVTATFKYTLNSGGKTFHGSEHVRVRVRRK